MAHYLLKNIYNNRIDTIKKLFPYIIVLIGVTMNILMWQRYHISDDELSSDPQHHNNIAEAILKGSSTTESGKDIGSIIMPGYPAIITSIYGIFGKNINYILVLQAFLSIIAVLLVYKLMKNRTNAFIAFLTACWILAYYPLWRMSFNLMKESLTASILIISFYFFHRFLLKQRTKDFIWFSILWAILIPVMNRFIVHFGLISLFLLYFIYKKEFKLNRIVIYGGLVLLVLVPWHIRQYLTFDEFVIFAPTKTEYAKTGEIKNSDKFDTYKEYKENILNSGFSDSRIEYFKKHFNREKFEQMKTDYNAFEGFNKYWSRFKGFFEIYPADMRFGFGGDTRITPPPSTIRKLTTSVFLAPMFIFMTIGLFFSIKKKNYFFLCLFVTILAHILLHSYIHYIPRYRLTILPAIFMLGWYGIYNVYEMGKNTIRKLHY